MVLLALAACVCTSVNSLGWAFVERARGPYAIPMLVGAVGGLASAAALLAPDRAPREPRMNVRGPGRAFPGGEKSVVAARPDDVVCD